VLGIYVETRNLGVIIPAPFQMKTGPDLPGREPDVLFVANSHLDRLQGGFLDGPADLVIEIISPESAARDRGEKFYEYAAGGVPEYWLIDPQSRMGEFYELEGNHYRTALSSNTGEYNSKTLEGLRVRIEWFWQSPLPPVLDILRELKIV
jgi:Uma2 family endonuclease